MYLTGCRLWCFLASDVPWQASSKDLDWKFPVENPGEGICHGLLWGFSFYGKSSHRRKSSPSEAKARKGHCIQAYPCALVETSNTPRNGDNHSERKVGLAECLGAEIPVADSDSVTNGIGFRKVSIGSKPSSRKTNDMKILSQSEFLQPSKSAKKKIEEAELDKQAQEIIARIKRKQAEDSGRRKPLKSGKILDSHHNGMISNHLPPYDISEY